jgi:probable addiction module antidote protein
MEKLTEFDMAEYLDTEELQQGYLDYNAKEGTPEDLLNAIKTVARARGMTKTAKEAGITRDGLYKALAPQSNPSFSTVWNILHSIGYTLTPTPLAKTAYS